VAAVLVAALVAGLVLRLTGGHGNPAVAHVGGQAIRRDQLDAVVTHFRKESASEGTPFPAESSPRFRALRNRLLALLVYRLELRQAAARLGIHVSSAQVVGRLRSSGPTDPDQLAVDSFQYDSVEAQLLLEAISRRVTRSIHGRTPSELAARRNRALAAFLARVKRETKVRYEPGYAPGP
jgi:hypothetical protein